MSGRNGSIDQDKHVAPKSSQRKTRAASKSTTPISENSSTSVTPTNSRRTTRSASRKNSAEAASGTARILKAQDIAVRASAAQDSEDLRRTIASRSLKRKAESQLPNEQPVPKLTKSNHDSEDDQPRQEAPSEKKRPTSTKEPHTCCKCVDKLRLELAPAAQAFHDQEEQIFNLNNEAEQYEHLIVQKEDYIQRLLRRLENTQRPVLCTAEEDLVEVLSASNEVLRKRNLEWRKELAARTAFEIVRPVEVGLRERCEELRRKLQEAEERVKVLEQQKGIPWVALPGQDGD